MLGGMAELGKLRPFTHRIYVDFSGDDGDPRTPGASRCMAIAWVLSAEDDLYHNQSVVLGIKKLIGCRAGDELKYRSLRHHKKKNEALSMLSQLRVKAVLAPVVKERIGDEELKNPRTKKLVNLIHDFPLNRILDYFDRECQDVYFQLVFDEVGWAGCQIEIERSFSKYKLDYDSARPDWLLFGKSGAILMLQLADIFAGLAHEYVEHVLSIKRPPCSVCWVRETRDCSYKRQKKKLGKASLIEAVYPLLLRLEDGQLWDVGFIPRPPAVRPEFLFVECLFGQ